MLRTALVVPFSPTLSWTVPHCTTRPEPHVANADAATEMVHVPETTQAERAISIGVSNLTISEYWPIFWLIGQFC
ncbi:hypothetical protein DL96DRAFT_1604270 [Flagelloscypha sp. PMI_526]|nr:hypothetical protein DL96DRAFT_1604270 [Flagelloscypha sp. PMI_526]